MSSARTARLLLSALGALAVGALSAPVAQAAFGIAPGSLDGSVLAKDATTVYTIAAGHPGSATVRFELNTELNHNGNPVSSQADLKDVEVEIPPGFVGNPLASPRCERQDFLERGTCPASTQVGHAEVLVSREGGQIFNSPVYNLEPPLGAPAEFGFAPGGAITLARPELRSDGDYGVTARVVNAPQVASILASTFTIWGFPSDPSHDAERGNFKPFGVICGLKEDGTAIEGPPCPSGAPQIPFWTMPTDCSHGPFETKVSVFSWQGHSDSTSFLSHNGAGVPIGVTGCEAVPFEPSVQATPTSQIAESAAGLDFELQMPTAGLTNPDGTAQAHIKKTVVTLPEGIAANPSAAEGLGVCSEADLKRETAFSAPGAGCPNASKIGDVSILTPLLEERLEGSLHVAKPFENRFGSLLALYIVAKSPERGIVVKLAGKVEPDPRTGQLVTTFDDLPQLPFSDFTLRFREGARAPLVTPPTCGTYETKAQFVPWSASDPDNPLPHEVVTESSSFQIAQGPNGGPCPSPGAPPFEPGFSAGTLNNNAASHSPLAMRITRRDGDQGIVRFDAELPPGLTAKLAGVSQCPDAAIALAKTKTGTEERQSPSCPATSEIGNVLAGAGVGSVLTYAPGKVYLAGPFGGAPISVVGVVPAVAGPFDVGTVVTRLALVIDSNTAEVRVDGSLSDPIPHILAGIPLRVRDIRVAIDRPDFTLNPTSCNPFSVGAALWGGGGDVFSLLDDAPLLRSDRFQAANCANLAFKPRISLKLIGGTKRGDHPALRAEVRPRPGDANIAFAAATLPKSAFLEQGHIRTICTRVQFAAEQCPAGSVYGHATAHTPLLDQPVSGLVYLRSSDNELPDVVAALKGPPSLPIDFDLVGKVDSVRGGIRNTFQTAPDVPVSRFVLSMQGGAKGLIVNSRNLCASTNRANVRLTAHNGRRFNPRPEVVATKCRGKGQKGKRARRGRNPADRGR
jgi:hypothetical protein